MARGRYVFSFQIKDCGPSSGENQKRFDQRSLDRTGKADRLMKERKRDTHGGHSLGAVGSKGKQTAQILRHGALYLG